MSSFHPTYASMYPPLQGFGAGLPGKSFLDIPFWACGSVHGVMCAAICWMPASLVAAVNGRARGMLPVLRFGVFSYWTTAIGRHSGGNRRERLCGRIAAHHAPASASGRDPDAIGVAMLATRALRRLDAKPGRGSEIVLLGLQISPLETRCNSATPRARAFPMLLVLALAVAAILITSARDGESLYQPQQ